MHLDEGQYNPLANNWYLNSILKGLRRHKGDGVSQKLPITDVILHGILAVLNLNNPFAVCFWAACLAAFFSFFSKSNLLVPSSSQFNPTKHLCVSDVCFSPRVPFYQSFGQKLSSTSKGHCTFLCQIYLAHPFVHHLSFCYVPVSSLKLQTPYPFLATLAGKGSSG